MYLGGLGLNCPGDPGCPGYVAPGSDAWQNSMLEAILANQVTAGATEPVPVSSPPAPASQWFKGLDNSTVLIAGGVVAFAVFMGRGRR